MRRKHFGCTCQVRDFMTRSTAGIAHFPSLGKVHNKSKKIEAAYISWVNSDIFYLTINCFSRSAHQVGPQSLPSWVTKSKQTFGFFAVPTQQVGLCDKPAGPSFLSALEWWSAQNVNFKAFIRPKADLCTLAHVNLLPL